MFTLKESDLTLLCQLNHFPIPGDEMIFFGLRGCLPIQDTDHTFRTEHMVEVVGIDYVHPRCTLGQWRPNQGIALFPGSTVPHRNNVRSALDQGGTGCNQLMTGFYDDYRKGVHKAGQPTGHEAFQQNHKLPIRRTADDLDYDADDRVEYMRPYDNLHAGWSMGVDHDRFSSAGCQVVVGYPKCEKLDNKPDTGPWKVFKENAYSISQDSFSYILLTGNYVQGVVFTNFPELESRLRFGSQGGVVEELQTKLKELAYYVGDIDGDFGPRTLFALLEFQTVVFGSDSDDGIVGPITADALGMNWPF